MNIIKKYFIANGIVLWVWELSAVKKEHDPNAEKLKYPKSMYRVAIALFGFPLYIAALINDTIAYFKAKGAVDASSED